MSKLAKAYRFTDLSDYGRPVATWIARRLKNTPVTPVHMTILFGICGLVATYCILERKFILAAPLLIIKSILDAADGELSREKNKPSYTGRFLDSIFDIILNALFLFGIGYITGTSFTYALLALLAFQLQGTLYNYYYVILRNRQAGGDTTSRVFENRFPMAFPWENQRTVNVLFVIFTALYGLFDRVIYLLDRSAPRGPILPNWFMTLVSIYGLGFQLLIIAVMLVGGLESLIIPFFIAYTAFMPVMIVIRRTVLG